MRGWLISFIAVLHKTAICILALAIRGSETRCAVLGLLDGTNKLGFFHFSRRNTESYGFFLYYRHFHGFCGGSRCRHLLTPLYYFQTILFQILFTCRYIYSRQFLAQSINLVSSQPADGNKGKKNDIFSDHVVRTWFGLSGLPPWRE